jgi:hypothetical protein
MSDTENQNTEQEQAPIMFDSTAEAVNHQKNTEVEKPHARSLELTLMSAGKLSLPPKIGVRDYNIEDTARLAMANEETVLKAIIEVLQSVIQTPGIDVLMIHEEDAKQVLLYILLNFWESVIERYPYTASDEELKALEKSNPERYERVVSGVEKLWCDVALVDAEGNSIIQLKPIADEFKEPFVLRTADKKSYAFRLPRLGDLLKVQDLIDKELASEELKFSDVKEALEKIDDLNEKSRKLNELTDAEKIEALHAKAKGIYVSINPALRREYNEFLRERTLRFVRYKQALCIVAENGKKLSTLEEKVAAYKRISVNTWRQYQQLVEKYTFGIDPKLKVKSPLGGGLVDREIRFRLLELIPTNEFGNTGQLDVSFGTIS